MGHAMTPTPPISMTMPDDRGVGTAKPGGRSVDRRRAGVEDVPVVGSIRIVWEIDPGALVAAGGWRSPTDDASVPEWAGLEVVANVDGAVGGMRAEAEAVLRVRLGGVESSRVLRAQETVGCRVTRVRIGGGAWTMLHLDGAVSAVSEDTGDRSGSGVGEGGGPWLRATVLLGGPGESVSAGELLLARTTLLSGALGLPGGVYQAPVWEGGGGG